MRWWTGIKKGEQRATQEVKLTVAGAAVINKMPCCIIHVYILSWACVHGLLISSYTDACAYSGPAAAAAAAVAAFVEALGAVVVDAVDVLSSSPSAFLDVRQNQVVLFFSKTYEFSKPTISP